VVPEGEESTSKVEKDGDIDSRDIYTAVAVAAVGAVVPELTKNPTIRAMCCFGIGAAVGF
jgi:hypothetical protein